MDVVYTWVDDTWPGHRELMQQHAQNASHDLNPNRTRDNLSILKYSLRSLALYAPWVRRVHLVTMRPQVPAWLNTERVRVVHHDALFSPDELPTFNSFAIVSRLFELADVTDRFLYMEDDRLLMRGTTIRDFVTTDGKHVLYRGGGVTADASRRAREDLSPWNRALAQSNHLLDQAYGPALRSNINYAPLLIDRRSFARFAQRFAEPLAHTRRSRFRSTGNVAPEHMYPYMLFHENGAVFAPNSQSRRTLGYMSLERFALYNRIGLAWLSYKSPKLCCLNDSFDHDPNPAAVGVARRFLERHFPQPSLYERA